VQFFCRNFLTRRPSLDILKARENGRFGVWGRAYHRRLGQKHRWGRVCGLRLLVWQVTGCLLSLNNKGGETHGTEGISAGNRSTGGEDCSGKRLRWSLIQSSGTCEDQYLLLKGYPAFVNLDSSRGIAFPFLRRSALNTMRLRIREARFSPSQKRA
jgi:hypothetical protein